MRHSAKRNERDELAVDQGIIYGWQVTWNPDDGFFYVGEDQSPETRFNAFRNAVQWARTHRRDANWQ